MTYLEELVKEKNHRILVEKLAFLLYIHSKQGINMIYGIPCYTDDEFKKITAKWIKETVKNTPYRKGLIKCAEEFSKIKLTED